MSKQTSFLFLQKVGSNEIRLKGFVTRLDHFTVATVTGADDIYFPLGAIGHEYAESEMQTWADDNGYDLTETDHDDKETILDELNAPTVFAVAVNGSDKMDLSWTDNNGATAKTHVARQIKVKEGNTLTAVATSNLTQGDYLIVRNQARKEYIIWVDIDAAGTAPTSEDYLRINGASGAIEVDVVTGDTATQVAVKIDAAITTAGEMDRVAVTYAAGATMTINQADSGLCQDITLAASNGGTIDVSSLSNVKDVEGADEGVYTEITIVNAGTDLYQDTGLASGKEHFYKVKHVISTDPTIGDSAYSSVASDSTP